MQYQKCPTHQPGYHDIRQQKTAIKKKGKGTLFVEFKHCWNSHVLFFLRLNHQNLSVATVIFMLNAARFQTHLSKLRISGYRSFLGKIAIARKAGLGKITRVM